MISWHKPGQKVTPVATGKWYKGPRWWAKLTGQYEPGPAFGDVVTVCGSHVYDDHVWLHLAEHLTGSYRADCFRPVYPTIIDQLRKLDAPSPERVKEDA